MPAPVSDIGAWSADVSGKDFCALLVDGRILCGDHFVTDATTHAMITNATSIALRGSVGLALLSDERVACFGAASTHVCPARDGNVWTSAVVPQIDHAVAIAAGNDFACAKSSDGHVKCWGSNEQGQLGAGYLSGPGAWLPPVTVQIDN